MATIVLVGVISLGAKAAPPVTEVRISLLGQPCTLQGPFSPQILKAIHAIGPAQIFVDPSLPNARAKIQEAQQGLKSGTTLPASIGRSLESYQSAMASRLSDIAAFLDGLERLAKTHHATDFQEIVKEHLIRNSAEKKELLTKGIASLQTLDPRQRKYAELVTEVFETYGEMITPDPEREFHHVLKKLGIRYLCSFDERD